jgi:hypothetical protein
MHLRPCVVVVATLALVACGLSGEGSLGDMWFSGILGGAQIVVRGGQPAPRIECSGVPGECRAGRVNHLKVPVRQIVALGGSRHR